MYLRNMVFSSFFLVIICHISLYSQERIIFDTDLDSDIDDVGALYMLHTFADQGDAEILATILSTTHVWSPFALDAINTFRGRPDIPIGAPFTEGVNKGSVYAETIAKAFPGDLGEHMKIEDATLLYRRILASQADSSVTMVTVGHLTNVANLLESKPDELSPLSGKELVQKKVKRWVAMLGEGMAWNMKWDRSAAATAINEFPAVVVQTVEGQEVRTGQRTQLLPDTNPIKTVYKLWKAQYGEIERSSWDQISTLFAVKGESNIFRLNRGTLLFSNEEGATWETNENGKDYRLYNRVSNEELAEIIEELMIQTPDVTCNSTSTSPETARSFPPEVQKELLNLHQLRSYRAGKNSFVLGLETISNRPALLGEYGRKTILNLEGTGSLRHIWETHGPGKSPFILEFFIDGEEEPSIRGPLDELVEAAMKCDQPFARPGGSTIDYGSYNFYLPVPFEKSLRVDLVANPRIGLVFLQLDYRLDDDSMEGMKLVQKANHVTDGIILQYESQTAINHAPATRYPETTTNSWRFTGDSTIRVEGPAIIRRLALNTKREGVKLLIRFDGDSSAAVNVDIADFFGPFRGVALNNNQSYFPMPFAASAEIELRGSAPHEEWKLETDIEKAQDYNTDWGYFHALHTRVDSSVGYLPFQVLSTRGKGHWVGMSIYDTHHDHGGGDFTVIDANTPRPSFLHGINGEDYFSFAFFGKGENFPYSEAFDNDQGRMRIHLENPYPFNESIAISWGVTEGLSPRSVAFWYQDTPQDLTMTEPEARGLEWSVFGPVTAKALLADGNSPDVSNLDRLFEVLPEESELDAGKTLEAEHLIFNQELKGSYHGWAKQMASGPYLNLMYAYGHVMSDLGGNHHMGYYARCMMARTHFISDKDQEVLFQLSYDDPLQLFVNGKKVYSDAERKDGFITREIEVELTKGKNSILVKMLDTPNNNTMWAGISLRVLDMNRKELENKY